MATDTYLAAIWAKWREGEKKATYPYVMRNAKDVICTWQGAWCCDDCGKKWVEKDYQRRDPFAMRTCPKCGDLGGVRRGYQP
jgi:predicted RNA-binding Zn-ribbon protein involved in translation (DUF1610 family)